MDKKIFVMTFLGIMLLGGPFAQAQYMGPSPALTKLGQRQAAEASAKSQPKHWAEELATNNKKRLDNIINAMELSLESHLEYEKNTIRQNEFLKGLTSAHRTRWQKNYNELHKAMKANSLFTTYQLTAIELTDFSLISADELCFLKNFFANKQKATEASNHGKFIKILLINENKDSFWLVIDIELQIVYFAYKNNKSLDKISRSLNIKKGKHLLT